MKSRLETAKNLAEAHFRVEPNLKRICLIDTVGSKDPNGNQDPNDPIKLLEVVEGTIERGIEPIWFVADPAHGIEYPSIIVEVSPTEYEAILAGDLPFGNPSWTLGRELAAR